jgi:CRISPR/Cas system CMR subunit Cmr6 (Cas7 group RAMP superfamily)|tara:strand:- start:292 stop:543 length:252 start_codon:yes stop_codon:yes gene_type:complete
MIAIANTMTVFAADKKNKGFKRLSKKIQKERDIDVDKIKEKVSDIFRDEQRRLKGYFEEHNKLIKKDDKPTKSGKKSIDFYEK